MSDHDSKAVVRQDPDVPGWRGNEHKLQVSAAQEAGLDQDDAALDLYTDAFKASMVMEDPEDKAIVLRGRTILKDVQLLSSLRPMLRFLKISDDNVAIRVHLGAFELRIAGRAAENAAPTLDSAKVALKTLLGFGLVGLMFTQVSQAAAAIAWGVGLLLAGYALRTGLVSGRAMLAARLAVSLAMFAQEEQLVLPLADSGKSTVS